VIADCEPCILQQGDCDVFVGLTRVCSERYVEVLRNRIESRRELVLEVVCLPVSDRSERTRIYSHLPSRVVRRRLWMDLYLNSPLVVRRFDAC
jgi:hypothetical protein